MRSLAVRVTAVFLVVGVPSTRAAPPPIHLNRRGEGGLVDLARATPLAAKRFGFAAWVDYLYGSDGQAIRLSPVSAGLGLPFGMEAAIAVSSAAPADPGAFDSGVQLHLGLKAALPARWTAPARLGFAFRVANTIGPPDLTPLFLAEFAVGDGTIATMTGYRFPSLAPEDGRIIGGLGGEYWFNPSIGLQLEGVAHVSPSGALLGTAAVATRFKIHRGIQIAVVLSGRHGDTSALNALIGLAYRPQAVPGEDLDGDGIVGTADLCPKQAEDKDGYEDRDGCPDPDNDGDGIPDTRDSTPNGKVKKRQRSGPTRMRLRIPPVPVPVWIMRDSGQRPKDGR